MGQTTIGPVRIEIAARTDRGVLRADNEDSLAVVDLARGEGHLSEFSGSGETVVLAVCDGMGGEAGGEVASRQAVESIQACAVRAGRPAAGDTLARTLLESLQVAARDVHALARARPEIGRMGTTATVCGLVGRELVLAQVGDSRAYLLREGRLTQMTRDQTLAAMLVERGQLQPEDARSFECGHVILQALGTSDTVEVDLTSVAVCRGDVLLVCSDGLSGPLEDGAIRDALESATSAAEASEALVRLANDAGGPDNVTCIVARIDGEGLPPPEGAGPVARKVCLFPETPTVPERYDPEVDLCSRDTEPLPAPSPLGRIRAFLGLPRRT